MIYAALVYEVPADKTEIEIDEFLFEEIAKDEKWAFRALYEKCASAVFAYTLSILRNREEAEDAMQETFLKIRSAAHLYKPQGKPMAWIFTIARNICLMRFRQMNRTVSIDDEEAMPDFGTCDGPDAEDRIVLETAFSVLSKEDCRIIMLHAVAGMKHREIADFMGIPLATVLSKYNRGIKRLRKELEGKI